MLHFPKTEGLLVHAPDIRLALGARAYEAVRGTWITQYMTPVSRSFDDTPRENRTLARGKPGCRSSGNERVVFVGRR